MTQDRKIDSLPPGWTWTTLGEVCWETQYGWTTSAASDGSVHLLRTTDITSGKIDWSTVPFCKEGPNDLAKYLLSDGDIVISRAGSIGYSLLIRNPKKAVFASYLIRFITLINKEFFAYFLQSPSYWDSISEKSLGIAIPNVNASKLRQIQLPLPPLAEQRRIVAKIEELFTKLDAGVKLLKEIQKQLKRYRQSVLKSAFEGNLTAEWREKYRHAERSRHFSSGESKHVTRMAAEALEDYSTSAHPSTPPIEDIGVAQGDNLTYEPASVLLERIKKERKEKLDKSSRGGSAFGGKYRARTERSRSELPPIDTSELPELPEGWVWARTGEVVENVQSVNPKIDLEKEFTYLDIASIDNTIQRITEPKVYYGNNAPSRARQLVKTGDILFSTVRTYLKNFAVVDEKYDGQIASTGFCVIRPHQSIDKKYVFYYIQTNEFLNPLTQIQRGTSYPAVRDSDVFEQKIPLTPYLEQLQIVSEIERHFSVADEVEKIVEQSLVQAERLRHSILKKAFEGKLVPQDPTDPPASVLLEQIKLEKEKKIERIKKEKDKTAKSAKKRKGLGDPLRP